jgi:DNA-binding SARP family transcriptional activator
MNVGADGFRLNMTATNGRNGSSGGALDGLAGEVAAAHPFGLVVVDADGVTVAQNPAAAAILGDASAALERGGPGAACELLGCETADGPLPGRCLHAEARRLGAALPEVRIDLGARGGAGAAWVVVAPLPAGRVLMHLRPGRADDRRRRSDPRWAAGPALRIVALGRTRVESPSGSLDGSWIANRPGQLLKYLVTHRGRSVSTDELAERLWVEPTRKNMQSVRYYVHELRARLEPEREARAPSSFVTASGGGYALELGAMRIDADEFEREVENGLAAAERGDDDAARERLVRGLELYRGDFLADEPYAEWAIDERDRLRQVATEGLRTLAALHRREGDLLGASEALERLCRLDPFDGDVHRDLLELLLERGRRTEAVRRYATLRHRMLSTFGEDLEFTLADLGGAR